MRLLRFAVLIEGTIHMCVQGEIAIHAETHDFIGETLGQWIETLGYGIGIGCIVTIFGVASAVHCIGIRLHAITFEAVCLQNI